LTSPAFAQSGGEIGRHQAPASSAEPLLTHGAARRPPSRGAAAGERTEDHHDDQGRFELDGVAEGPQELYVSAVDFILVKRTVTVISGAAIEVTMALAEGTGTYAETVTVVGTSPARATPRWSDREHTARGASWRRCACVARSDHARGRPGRRAVPTTVTVSA